jgi:hypothetical protein
VLRELHGNVVVGGDQLAERTQSGRDFVEDRAIRAGLAREPDWDGLRAEVDTS